MTKAHETISRGISRIMFSLCVMAAVSIVAVLGLVTGFLTIKGYKGILAQPKQIHGAIVSVNPTGTPATVTVEHFLSENTPPQQQTFAIGSNTTVSADGNNTTIDQLKPGTPVEVRFNVADPKVATGLFTSPQFVEGKVVAASNDSITVVPQGQPSAAYSLSGATIKLDGKTGDGNALAAGSVVRVQVSRLDPTKAVEVDFPIPFGRPAIPAPNVSAVPPLVGEDPKPSALDPDYPGGLRNGIVGTLILISLASVVGIPAGILCGIFLAEYSANSTLAVPVRFIADVLTGVPSIVVGILGYELLVRPFRQSVGFNGWAGALALAFIMIPLVARTTEEMLLLVPRSYREASVALGATKARTILKVVMPAASGSVTTGVMLAIARVAGETAPLLFTIVGLDSLEWNPSHQFPAITLQIYKDAMTADDQQNRLAWAGILLLLTLIFLLNVVVRATGKTMRREKTA